MTLVRHAVADGIGTITLARPQANNAMSWDFIDDLARAAEAVTGDSAVRAILIEAEGKNFCVGGDIRSFASEADPAAFLKRLADRLHDAVRLLAGGRAPVIVAVQGAAAGAGLSLAAAGDLVIAGREASFTLAYAGIGLTADGGATWLLPRLIGLRLTQEMAFTGRRLSAEEAERAGLVTRVVDESVLAEEARALAAKIGAGPTLAFGRIRQLLAASGGAALDTQLDAESASMGEAMATADARGAVAAFLERRAPAFTGA